MSATAAWRCGLIVALTAAVLPACAGPERAAPAGGGGGSPPGVAEMRGGEAGERVPGEYIVAVEDEGGPADIDAAFAAHGPEIVRDMGRGRFLIRLADDPGPRAVAEAAAAAPAILHAEPNRIYRTPTPPNSGKRFGE